MRGVTSPKAPSPSLPSVAPRAARAPRGAIPAAWSNHGRHHRSLCRAGSAGLLGAVERQWGLSGATMGAPTPVHGMGVCGGGSTAVRSAGLHRSLHSKGWGRWGKSW